MTKKIWMLTVHKGKGNENITKTFAKYETVIKYLEKANIMGATLKKVDFVDENQKVDIDNFWSFLDE